MKVNVVIDTTLTEGLKEINRTILSYLVKEVLGYNIFNIDVNVEIEAKPIMDELPTMFRGLKVIRAIPESLSYQTPIFFVMEKGCVKDVYTRTSSDGNVFLKKTPLFKKSLSRIEALNEIYKEIKNETL